MIPRSRLALLAVGGVVVAVGIGVITGIIPFPGEFPRVPPLPNPPPDCASAARFGKEMLERLRKESFFNNTIEEVKRRVRYRWELEPTAITIPKPGETAELTAILIEVLEDPENVLSLEETARIQTEVKARWFDVIGSLEAWMKSSFTFLKGSIGPKREYKGGWVDTENAAIAVITQKAIFVQNEIIAATVHGEQTGQTRVIGGVAELTIQLALTFEVKVSPDANPCPSIPLSFPVALKLDTFAVPVQVLPPTPTPSPTPTPPPTPTPTPRPGIFVEFVRPFACDTADPEWHKLPVFFDVYSAHYPITSLSYLARQPIFVLNGKEFYGSISHDPYTPRERKKGDYYYTEVRGWLTHGSDLTILNNQRSHGEHLLHVTATNSNGDTFDQTWTVPC